MLCDGRIVCGCADPYGHRVLGDVRSASVRDAWTGSTITTLREDLNGGGSKFCGDCPLKLPLKKDDDVVVRSLDAGPLPSRMYIECTAACNISCAEACCRWAMVSDGPSPVEPRMEQPLLPVASYSPPPIAEHTTST